MPYTSPLVGNPLPCIASGAFAANTMITGMALPGGNSVVFSYIANLSATAVLFASFGSPVTSSGYHLVLNPSGTPFTDPGMIKVPIYVSGGSFLAWSM